MQKILLFLFLSLFLNATTLKIASYNVENLFDMENNGHEYDAYKPNKHNWTRENLKQKLQNVSEVICDVNADIIGLQEIENENVLKLLKKSLKNIGCYYKYHAISHKQNSAIQVALLSKVPIKNVKEISVNRKLKYRNILEAKFMIEDEALYVFVNHWSSKRSAESARSASAKALVQRLKDLDKASAYILLGDFNNDYDEYLQLAEKHNDTAGQTGINHGLKTITKQEKFLRKEALVAGNFFHYNLWLELPNYKRWSHNFYGNKQALDAILLPHTLFDGKGMEYVDKSFSVLKKRYLFHKKGYIFRWAYKKNRHQGKGYSDHLPVMAHFSTKKPFKQESKNPHVGSIDKLQGKAHGLPMLLKHVKVMTHEKNKVKIAQKASKKTMLIYGTEKSFQLGHVYDVMVYGCKNYEGEYEIIDFEIEKRYDAPTLIKESK
ncbi:MAG: Unknown protein [uncultured Sulfurovum sp.]|uniref:Endonuclease/exonuclease/phosphatase domain-containing protein n=1 Tax=uncultured Sulfurovum sp. TaxID=269237 RepID=A0A6S6UHT5_9BACT|nr:MAG: Unknown protein [uncultured Sulfurovum sp.]